MRQVLALIITAGLAQAADMGLGQELYRYEPTYFACDPGVSESPQNAKFQFSIAIRLLGLSDDAGVVRPDGLYAAFSQTSFWDLQSQSKPFYDSSYRPETWWHSDLSGGNLALEPGLGHESNGRDGDESRSLNHVFLRLLGRWESGGLTLTAAPRAKCYIKTYAGQDMQRYRGYLDLVGTVQRDGGWGASATGRIGSHADRGSLMVELSHPIEPWTGHHMHGYLYLQGFWGWSETLLAYDQQSPQPRILLGFALTR
jgi:phospholipase A1/A2